MTFHRETIVIIEVMTIEYFQDYKQLAHTVVTLVLLYIFKKFQNANKSQNSCERATQ